MHKLKVDVAKAMQAVGIIRAMELLRSKPGVLVINHHRIGKAEDSCFDRGVFSATEEELDAQVRYFKKRAEVLTGEEMRSVVSGETKLERFSAFFTFDDGYLDNYTSAYRVLRSNGAAGAFFIVPSYVGSATIPWWDEIAYRIRNTSKPEICLRHPVPFRLTLAQDREPAISTVLGLYKGTDMLNADALMEDLRASTQCELPPDRRRFLNWEEAKEMHNAGMEIGSHTTTHAILGRLSPEEQKEEIEGSKKEIEARMGSKVLALAYPVGARNSFNEVTMQTALSAGYTMCFSFYGGINHDRGMQPANLLRGSMPRQPDIFRARAALMAAFG